MRRRILLLVTVALLSTGAFAAKTAKPKETEKFQNNPLSRWAVESGKWAVKEEVELYDVDQRQIYISPEEPSHVAWTGLWKELDGSIKTCFVQVSGNPGLAPSYAPTYGRDMTREQWLKRAKEWNMQDGPEDAVTSTRIDFPTLVTRNGGKSWKYLGLHEKLLGGNLRYVTARDGTYICRGLANLVCRDGRILATANPQEWMQDGQMMTSKYILGICESKDNGKTWSDMQFIPTPEGTDPTIVGQTCEESDITELSDGRILMVIRTEKQPVKTYLTRVAPGKFTATPPVWLPFGHSGLPDLVRCSDGVIWYFGIDGHWCSLDEGETWQHISLEFPSYYGKMIDAGPNTVLCVTQQGSGDSAYPIYQNSTINALRFSYNKTGVMEQKDDKADLALIKQSKGVYGDLHLRAHVKVDKVSGLAFHISPDGRSYYALAVVMPGSDVYERWLAPKAQEDTLSATYYAEKNMFATGDPMLALVRVDNGIVTPLRRVRERGVSAGMWIELQVKITGNLIQGALNTGNNGIYTGANDSNLKSGAIGLITDHSLGAFKNLTIWNKPQMIRDLWTIGKDSR